MGFSISTMEDGGWRMEDGEWRMDRPKYLPKTGDTYTHFQTNIYT